MKQNFLGGYRRNMMLLSQAKAIWNLSSALQLIETIEDFTRDSG